MPDIFEKEFDASRFNLTESAVRVGDDINITAKDPAMRKILAGLGWDSNAFDADAVDVDASCFLLDKNNQTRADEDFVFYNSPEAHNGAVQHTGDSRTGAGDGDDETIMIDIHGVPFDVVRILFVVSIYGAHEKEQNLGLLRNSYFRIVNADRGEELLRYDFTAEVENRRETAFVVAALDREGPKWHVRPMNEFYAGGLAEVAAKFGIIVAEKAS